MIEYSKIETIWERDEETRKVLVGQYRLPVFEFLSGCRWMGTEKIDGTNIRVGWDGANVEFGGRTDNAQIPATLVKKLIATFPPEKMMETYPETKLTLFGEGFGAKIQACGGKYNSTDVNFILFDVLIDKWWLNRADVEDIGGKLGLMVVPVVIDGGMFEISEFVRSGFQSVVAASELPAEGVVLRPSVELFNRSGSRIIAKIKTRDF